MDECALMCVIRSPASDALADYIRNFMQYVMGYWVQSDLYLVFDQYYEQSKCQTWAKSS